MGSSSFNLWFSSHVVICLSTFFSNPSSVSCRQSLDHSADELQTYIIQVEKPTQSLDEQSLLIWYKSAASSEWLLRAYGETFYGFAAKLGAEELDKVTERKGFLRAYQNRVLSLTTHTPDLLSLKVGRGLRNRSNLDGKAAERWASFWA